MGSISQAAPKINGARLWDNIMETAKFGCHESIEGGMSRLSLSAGDKQVRDWFVNKAIGLGCEVKIDKMGNIFATWYGGGPHDDAKSDLLPPIGMGSHLDTQPMGGRFDGILGVLSALEIIQIIKESGIELSRPIVAIDWTNEEGARFPAMCSGSSVWAAAKTIDELHNLASLTHPDETMKSALQEISYLGETESSYKAIPLSAHFELHIEQATLLERTGMDIGIVSGVQGMRWYEVHILGAEGHAGSTPMNMRTDAMVAAAKFILHVEKMACKYDGFGTVGYVKPGSEATNTIVGSVRMMVDLRHPSEETLDEIEESYRVFLADLEAEQEGRLGTTMERTWENAAVTFDEKALQCVSDAAESVCGKSKLVMTSCAGHDSVETAKVVPTAMIFVPSRDGISHNPKEYSTPAQCSTGAQVLLESVLNYDNLLRKEGTKVR